MVFPLPSQIGIKTQSTDLSCFSLPQGFLTVFLSSNFTSAIHSCFDLLCILPLEGTYENARTSRLRDWPCSHMFKAFT